MVLIKYLDVVKAVREKALKLTDYSDLDSIIDVIGDAKYVLIGEATHGTSEFYAIRAELSKLLIQKKGFSFVAVEGDWPSCYSVNRYCKGYSEAKTDIHALLKNNFKRWPTWMWSNTVVEHFIKWLRDYNMNVEKKVGFYGIDMYSLFESMEEIINYLEKTGSEEVDVAKKAFSCFNPFEKNEQDYAMTTAYLSESCEEEVLKLLMDIQAKRVFETTDGEESLSLELNALVAASAELYYRSMVKGDAETWNIRDRHMAETIERLSDFYGPDAKVIVWEHNTHIGDARATDMAQEGMVNVGQLMREKHGSKVFAVGFGTYEGTVIAGSSWGSPLETLQVPPASKKTWEEVLHKAGHFDQILLPDLLHTPLFDTIAGHRAIGVVYDPAYEHYGNYVPTNLAKRYDSFIFIDKTSALTPI